MVDANAFIILPGAALIIPKGIFAVLAVKLVKHIIKAEVQNGIISGMGFVAVGRFAPPTTWVMRIARSRDDICLLYTSDAADE